MSDKTRPIVGDLVYVPSQVSLKRVHRGSSGITSVTDFITLDTPATMLVSQSAEDSIEVVYKGSKWTIESKYTYPVNNHQ